MRVVPGRRGGGRRAVPPVITRVVLQRQRLAVHLEG